MDTLKTEPMGFLHYLYYAAVQEAKTDEGKARKEAEELEDTFEEGGVTTNEPRRVPRNFVLRPKTEAERKRNS